MPSSRRAFIKTAVLAAGAVFTDWRDLTAAPPRHLPARIDALRYTLPHEILRDHKRSVRFPRPSEEVDCVIVGAGVSGFAAAWRLRKEGKSFLILDGEPVAGGAAREGTWHGQEYALGSAYYVTYEGTYKEIYDDIGLKLEHTPADAMYFGNGEMHVDWWTEDGIAGLPIPAGEKDSFRRFRDAVIKFQGLPEYPLSNAKPEMIAKYDPMSATEYLKQFNSPFLTRLMDQYNFSSLGGRNDEVNAYCFLNFYASEFGDAFELPRYSFPGGMVGMIAQFRRRLGAAHCRTGALVLQVENVGNHVEARYIDAHGEPHAVRALSAVMAAQKRIVHNVVTQMPKSQSDLCTQVRYAPYITVNLLCHKPILPHRTFDMWCLGTDLLFTDMVDGSSMQDARKGSLDRNSGRFTYCVYCPQLESERKHLQEPAYLAAFAQRLAENVEAHVPGARGAISEMVVFAWGHTMVIPAVGSHALMYPAVSQPVGNIYFANTDNDISPSVESGIINGHGAAEQLIAALK